MGLSVTRATDTIEVGTGIEFEFQIKDEDDVLIDPATLAFTILDSGGATFHTSAIGDFTNTAVGIYEIRVQFTAAGTYRWDAIAETPSSTSHERIRGHVIVLEAPSS